MTNNEPTEAAQKIKKEKPKKIRERFGFLENAVMWINERVKEGYVFRELSLELEDFNSTYLVVEMGQKEKELPDKEKLPLTIKKKFNNQSDAFSWVLDMEKDGYYLKTYSVDDVERIEFEGDERGDISIVMKLEEKCL